MFLLCLSKEELKEIENQVMLAFSGNFLLEGFDSVSSDKGPVTSCATASSQSQTWGVQVSHL